MSIVQLYVYRTVQSTIKLCEVVYILLMKDYSRMHTPTESNTVELFTTKAVYW